MYTSFMAEASRGRNSKSPPPPPTKHTTTLVDLRFPDTSALQQTFAVSGSVGERNISKADFGGVLLLSAFSAFPSLQKDAWLI